MSSLSVIDPSTEGVLAVVPEADVAQLDAAVEAATRAFPAWAAVAPPDRARLLRRLAGLVESHGEELARTESRNAGKPISAARAEVALVGEVFHFYAGSIDKHYGQTIPVDGGVDMTFREPLGAVGLIVPWNFLLAIASWKVAPALACGNTVVLKPAELTPLTALRLGELVLEAGIPAGALNVVVGPGRTVGQRFADADLEAAAAAAPYAVFDNAGQDCCARSRILVEASVHDRFVELLIAATAKLRVGDVDAPDTEMGPLISASHRAAVASFVDGDVAYQGSVPDGPGYWFAPTILTGVSPTDRVVRDEVFGPVVAVLPFADEADAVRLATTASTACQDRFGRPTGRGR